MNIPTDSLVTLAIMPNVALLREAVSDWQKLAPEAAQGIGHYQELIDSIIRTPPHKQSTVTEASRKEVDDAELVSMYYYSAVTKADDRIRRICYDILKETDAEDVLPMLNQILEPARLIAARGSRSPVVILPTPDDTLERVSLSYL